MLEATVFADGTTTLPKAVRDALGVNSGDTVRYIICEDSVQILRTRSARGLAGMLAREGQAPVCLDAMETAISEGAIESGK